MWTIIKLDIKQIEIFKKDLQKRLGKDFIIYNPKLLLQKYKKNKLINKEFNLLGDYAFCFHKNFADEKTINNLKFTKGLKYFLGGFFKSQNEITNFIERCKNNENKQGYLSQNFFEINLDKKYKFLSGPFSDMIFNIIEVQKNKISTLIGGVKTEIEKNNFLFKPI
jgi:hypothetical protein